MESRIDSSSDDENSGITESETKADIEARLERLAIDIKKLPSDRVNQLENLFKDINKRVLSIQEVADILDCSIDTVRRMIKSGSLKAFQLNKAGKWRVKIEELEKFMSGENQE